MSASDRVVANSKFSRGVVQDVFGLERLGDVEVVYPCVDMDLGNKLPEKTKEDPLWNGKKILLSINRFERKKDMALAIRAYNGLGPEKRKGTRLVIAGEFFSMAILYSLTTILHRRLRQSCQRECSISPGAG
jgi:alpha-1,3/alpha-1,6-mannosyltransferase